MRRPDLVGALVTFAFSTHPNLTGRVKWTPANTGDAWHIVDEDGVMFLIQQFDWMRVEPPVPDADAKAPF